MIKIIFIFIPIIKLYVMLKNIFNIIIKLNKIEFVGSEKLQFVSTAGLCRR